MGSTPNPCSLEKKAFIVATKIQTIIYMASWKTVQFDSSVVTEDPEATPPSCIHVYTHLEGYYAKTPGCFYFL